MKKKKVIFVFGAAVLREADAVPPSDGSTFTVTVNVYAGIWIVNGWLSLPAASLTTIWIYSPDKLSREIVVSVLALQEAPSPEVSMLSGAVVLLSTT